MEKPQRESHSLPAPWCSIEGPRQASEQFLFGQLAFNCKYLRAYTGDQFTGPLN